MTDAKKKEPGQVRAIYGLARASKLDDELLHDAVEFVTGRTRSIADLTFSEANKVIEHLGGRKFAASGSTPRRTTQYRRAKEGVTQVVQPGQLELIAKLATQRNWKPDSLIKFCRRQAGHHPLRTTQDANKVIEALKSMNRREGLWA
jgi:hypothetical protein